MRILILALILGISYLSFAIIQSPTAFEFVGPKSLDEVKKASGLNNPSVEDRDSSPSPVNDTGGVSGLASAKQPAEQASASSHAPNLTHEQKLDQMRQRGEEIAHRMAADRQSARDAMSWFALPVRVQARSEGVLICEVDVPDPPATVYAGAVSGLGSVGGAAGETGGGRSAEPNIAELVVAEAPGGGARRRLPRAGDSFGIIGHPDYEKVKVGDSFTTAMVPGGLEHIRGQTLQIFRFYDP